MIETIEIAFNIKDCKTNTIESEFKPNLFASKIIE